MPHLVVHFANGRPVDGAALRLLQCRAWPGNVRELKQVVDSAFVFGRGTLDVRAIETSLEHRPIASSPQRPKAEANDYIMIERARLIAALENASWDTVAVSKALGVHRSTLYRRLKRLTIILPPVMRKCGAALNVQRRRFFVRSARARRDAEDGQTAWSPENSPLDRPSAIFNQLADFRGAVVSSFATAPRGVHADAWSNARPHAQQRSEQGLGRHRCPPDTFHEIPAGAPACSTPSVATCRTPHARSAERRRSAITVVLILGLAIGMSSAMFTVFRSVLVERLPVQAAGSDRRAVRDRRRRGERSSDPARADAAASRQSQTLAGVSGLAHWRVIEEALTDGDRRLRSSEAVVSDDFFSVLGASPALGRLFRKGDAVAVGRQRDRHRRPLVLSHAAWQREFGGDSSVIGRRCARRR